MRVLGPKKKFTHLKRTESETVNVYGQETTWTNKGAFYGVVNAVPKQPDGQNIFHGRVGVQIHYKMRTMYTDLTEKDRLQMFNTSRVFSIEKVDDLMEQGKYKIVELHEVKE